jgi:hypothetical protein
MDLGYEVQTCLVDLRETAESVVSDTLSQEKFDCIMIGAGTRMIPQHTLLFEKIINTICSVSYATEQLRLNVYKFRKMGYFVV